MSKLKKFIGTKEFYLMTLAISLPMIGQNLITNFVSMIDNIMIGQIGTNQMNAVSIVNQFMMVFNLTIFGGLSGAGIFGTQFSGKGDYKGQQYTFCYRLYLALLVSILGLFIFTTFQDNLISLFLSSKNDSLMNLDTLRSGKEYLNIILFSLLPFSIGQAYATVLREAGHTKVPMYGSMSAIGINVVLNYVLIFGKFGFPTLGVKGAAIATVIAKCVETIVMIRYAHTHLEDNPYLYDLIDGFKIPFDLVKKITLQGLPLLFNEFLWSLGMSIIAQCYSYRGLDVVAARNIASTLTNLFSTVFIQLGGAAGIIIGKDLGAGKFDEAVDDYHKLVLFDIVVSTLIALLMIPVAQIFPTIYNTTSEIKSLASFYIVITAFAIPIFTYTNLCYFTLRSGGKTFVTFLYDAIFTWLIQIPTAFIICYMTNLDIRISMVIITYIEIVKVIVGFVMVKSRIWVQNIVSEE